MEIIETVLVEKPFVGLRPFEESDSMIFFGRDEQIQQLLNRLYHSNFVAVIGNSGSGKSSLIKAGLIPKLKGGFLKNHDSWKISSFRPGEKPLYNFAKSLVEVLKIDQTVDDIATDFLSEGIETVVKRIKSNLSAQEGLFLLVDQFEEIFTYDIEENNKNCHNIFTSETSKKEFVRILMELSESGLPIYICLTMRSDFIGKCNQFHGFPEHLNNNQFLVPRLSFQQLKKVVEHPIKLVGSKIDEKLTTQILNDLPSGEDQLPVLQHSMSRLWVSFSESDVFKTILTSKNYHDNLKPGKALSDHANLLYEELAKNDIRMERLISETFKYLTKSNVDHEEGVRRPRKVSDIKNVTGASTEELKRIYSIFSAKNTSFLYSNYGEDLEEDTIIEISHESLMREWDKFHQWRNEEEEDKKLLFRLKGYHEDFDKNEKNIIPKAATDNYLVWHKIKDYENEYRQNVIAWAKRYETNFTVLYEFIKRSKRNHRKSDRISNLLFIAILLVLLASATIYIRSYIKETEKEAELALERQKTADSEKKRAEDKAIAAREKTVLEEKYTNLLKQDSIENSLFIDSLKDFSNSQLSIALNRVQSLERERSSLNRKNSQEIERLQTELSIIRSNLAGDQRALADTVREFNLRISELENEKTRMRSNLNREYNKLSDSLRSSINNYEMRVNERTRQRNKYQTQLDNLLDSFIKNGEADVNNEWVVRVVGADKTDIISFFIEYRARVSSSSSYRLINDSWIVRDRSGEDYLVVIDAINDKGDSSLINEFISQHYEVLRNEYDAFPLCYNCND